MRTRAESAGTSVVASYCCYVLQDPKGKRSMGPRQLRLAGFSISGAAASPNEIAAPFNSSWNLFRGRGLSLRTSDPQISVMKTRNADESRRSATRRRSLDWKYGSLASHQCRRGSNVSEHLRLRARELQPPRIVRQRVLVPVCAVEQQRRFIAGYSAALQPAHAWDLDALAGAGAIRSTAGDMLKYLEANLHPRTLSAAFARSHELRADVGPGTRIAYTDKRGGFAGVFIEDLAGGPAPIPSPRDRGVEPECRS